MSCNLYEEVESVLGTDAGRRFQDNFFDEKNLTPVENLNKFWRSELKSTRKSMVTEAAALDDSFTESEWLSYFKSIVLPTVVRFKLPR